MFGPKSASLACVRHTFDRLDNFRAPPTVRKYATYQSNMTIRGAGTDLEIQNNRDPTLVSETFLDRRMSGTPSSTPLYISELSPMCNVQVPYACWILARSHDPTHAQLYSCFFRGEQCCVATTEIMSHRCRQGGPKHTNTDFGAGGRIGEKMAKHRSWATPPSVGLHRNSQTVGQP